MRKSIKIGGNFVKSNEKLLYLTTNKGKFDEAKLIFNDIYGVKNNVKHDITKLFYGRIILNRKYYNNNGLLESIYNYFDKIIEKNYKENLE